jgi:hypothetical protein
MKYLGKNLKGSDIIVATKLNISQADVQRLKTNTTRYLINETTGDVTKINLSDSPLLLRKFGIKRTNNKLIKGGRINKNIIISKDPLSLAKPITGRAMGTILVVWKSSGNPWENPESSIIDANNTILNDEKSIKDQMIADFLDENLAIHSDIMRGEAEISVINLEFITKNDVSLQFDNMRLRGVNLDIRRIYGESVDLNKSNDNNCVRNYLLQNYKITSKVINKLGNKDGVTPCEIKQFCIKYKIKLILFNIDGDIITQFTPEVKNKSYKSLIAIIYNNHLYPLNNKELHRIPKKDITKCIYIENLDNKLIDILNKNDVPSNVGIYLNEITNIELGNTIYHKNKDYDFCNDILKKFGLGDNMTAFVNKKNIFKIIEKLFVKSSVDSFFPYSSCEGGYSYFNEDFVEDKNTITIDHNKHYSDALRKLKNLITIDIKTAKHINKPKELLPNYFYIASPKYSNILMSKTGFYSYEHLKYCTEEGVDFELKEAISCQYKENYFTDMVNTLYTKLSNEEFKFIVNCMIGSFEKKRDRKPITKYVKIANEDETKTTDKFVRKINDDYNIIFDVEDKVNTNVFNRVPIRVQVLCEARRIVYEKIKELKLNRGDIKQIRTDAITFKFNVLKRQEKFFKSSVIGEWKEQACTDYKNNIEIYDQDMTFELNCINKNNKIYIDYAGSGKTYHIINNLLPTLQNYIVMSPSQASIVEYRNNNINCQVIQYYTLNNKIPVEDVIIIDEVGMLDSHMNNLIVKCALLGKTIYSFGDFKQMKPVNGEPCCNENYLNYVYGSIEKLGTNYRNDFTFEYYDELISMTNKKQIKNEIIKYNSKSYDQAETIITYTNETRKKYNNMMCQKLNIEFGDINCRVVCKTNDLKDKGIYNNFYCTIYEIQDDNVILYDGVNDYIINIDELNKYFELGYCRTLYNIQGASITSFYYALEDIDYIDGRALYTLVSRIKNI